MNHWRAHRSGRRSRFFSSSASLAFLSALFTGLLLLFTQSGCKPSSGNAPGGDTIPVGEYTSLTGKEATYGISSHNATRMAVDEINSAGGVLGKQLRLICEDNQSKAGEAANAARKLISRDRVVALLGEVASSRTLEVAPIAQEAKIPLISPASTNPKVTEVGDYVFRVCFTDRFQGRVLADFALKTIKAKKLAILSDLKSDYSKGLAECFKERFVAKGGQIVAEPSYSGGDKDFKAQLTAIKGTEPDAILVPGYYTDVGLIVMQAKQLGIKVPLFGGDGWESPKLLSIGGAALEGHYFSTHYSMEVASPKIQSFVKHYQERYGEYPDALAALGYDSAYVLADAMKRAGTTESKALRDAIAATKDFETVTGKITIDAERNPQKPAVILTIKNGQFKLLETIQPD
jgi:branched-chain amino acid transport system substrate-binding protein